MSHIDDGLLTAWLDRPRSALTAVESAKIEAHLSTCVACRARLEEAGTFRGRSSRILAASGPTQVATPSFEKLLDRAPVQVVRPSPRPNYVTLAWAASIMAALGLGWLTRD